MPCCGKLISNNKIMQGWLQALADKDHFFLHHTVFTFQGEVISAWSQRIIGRFKNARVFARSQMVMVVYGCNYASVNVHYP